jgi:hypothetical protein
LVARRKRKNPKSDQQREYRALPHRIEAQMSSGPNATITALHPVALRGFTAGLSDSNGKDDLRHVNAGTRSCTPGATLQESLCGHGRN